jgi:hypothetical protein
MSPPGAWQLFSKIFPDEWNAEEFLLVRPEKKVASFYDWGKVVTEG